MFSHWEGEGEQGDKQPPLMPKSLAALACCRGGGEEGRGGEGRAGEEGRGEEIGRGHENSTIGHDTYWYVVGLY